MKSNLKQIGLIIGGVILLFFLMWMISTNKEKSFKSIIMNDLNHIRNTTDKKYLDTIIYVGLKNLHITNVSVLIKPLSEASKYNFRENGDLRGYIRYDGELFTIFIDEMSTYESIEIISHELIHLEQYKTRRLVVRYYQPTWEGEDISLEKVSYENRPWEIEAFQKQDDLSKKMKKDLY